MRLKHTLLFIINLLWVCSFLQAQEVTENDTIDRSTKYGLRLGADLSKPLRSLLDKNYTGFEVNADYRVTKRFYAAAELGNETKDFFEPNLNVSTSGSYVKLGFDYNAYNNWLGLNNAIFAGLRVGTASFKQDLIAYRIYTSDATFQSPPRIVNQEYKGLNAQWAELIVGIKTEVLNNLYLSFNLQLKREINEKVPVNFDNIYIPGFNKTNDFSKFGAGYGYTISYLIPLYKK